MNKVHGENTYKWDENWKDSVLILILRSKMIPIFVIKLPHMSKSEVTDGACIFLKKFSSSNRF